MSNLFQQNKLKKYLAALFMVVVSVASVSAHMEWKWVKASNGYIPDNAVVIGGREANGQILFICRANYRGGVHPGKIRTEFGGCNIPWGGKEIVVRDYEVLTF